MAGVTATILAITAIVGTGLSVYSSEQQKKSQEDAAQYNATLAEKEAENTEAQNAEQIRRGRIQKRQQLARIRTNLAAGGTLTTSGTPLAMIGDASANLELGLQDSARAASLQAASLRSQGNMGLWAASQQGAADDLSAAGSVLSGAGSYIKGYDQLHPARTSKSILIG